MNDGVCGDCVLIKYNEAVLGQFAREQGIATERAVRTLPEPEQADLAARLYDRLADAGSAPVEEPTVGSPRKAAAPV